MYEYVSVDNIRMQVLLKIYTTSDIMTKFTVRTDAWKCDVNLLYDGEKRCTTCKCSYCELKDASNVIRVIVRTNITVRFC